MFHTIDIIPNGRMRLTIVVLAVFVCFSIGCQTSIRSGGIGGNTRPDDPDVEYFEQTDP